MTTTTKATAGLTLHRDGAVTYWSVYRQGWVRRARQVPDREYAAMTIGERRRLDYHLAGVPR